MDSRNIMVITMQLKQICNTCGAQLNPTRDPDIFNCVNCGKTIKIERNNDDNN